jgi:hypothetical protein
MRKYLEGSVREALHAVLRARHFPERCPSDALANAQTQLRLAQDALASLRRGRYGLVLAFMLHRWKHFARLAIMLSLRGQTPESRTCERKASRGKGLYLLYCDAYMLHA